MKKRDFKSLALMGLTSGLLVSSQTGAANEDLSGSLAAAAKAGCKGKNGCPGLAARCASCSGIVADRDPRPPSYPSWGGCGSKCSHTASRDAPSPSQPSWGGCGSKCSHTASRDAPPASQPDYTSPNQNNSSNNNSQSNPNDGNLGYHLMSEEELMLELNSEGIKLYNNLNQHGKALALQVASARCNGMNSCSHLNACRTEKNTCAGMAACKGQGKCAFSDKNLAVRLVYQKMKGKRSAALRE